MSEFTGGTLFLNRDRQRVEEKMREIQLAYKLKVLNEKWSAFFFDDGFLATLKSQETIREVSKVAPLLYFRNFADHGWEYQVIDGGEWIATLDVSYELEEVLARMLAEEKYPELDYLEDLVLGGHPEGEGMLQSLIEEVMSPPEFRRQLESIYEQANVQAFARFDLSAEKISALQGMLSPTFHEQSETPWRQADEFKKLLGIEEMEWISFDKLEDREVDVDYDPSGESDQ